MKYLVLFFFAALALFSSCSTDLDVNAPYQDLTVVYGLLNAQDQTQYIRIEKGYLDKSTSALTLAQIPDSIYYGDVLKVQMINQGNNDTISLEKVMGDTIGIPKDSGTFANSPNILYRMSRTIDANQTYKILIVNTSTGKVVTASTAIVKDFQIGRPLNIAGSTVDLAATNTDGTSKPLNIQWTGAVNAQIYSAVIRFYYTEWNVSSPSVVDTLYADWNVIDSYASNNGNGGEAETYNVPGKNFYVTMGNIIPVKANIQRRAIGSPLEVRFAAGGVELYNYLRVSQTQTGITALQAQAKYTNVSNGLGIFSSRYNKVKSNITISSNSIDSLVDGSYTKKLNFVR